LNIIDKIKKEKIKKVVSLIYSICIEFNIDKKNLIKYLLNYIIRNLPIHNEFLLFVENLMHINLNNNVFIHYTVSQLKKFYSTGL
jgi:hypothetical protein